MGEGGSRTPLHHVPYDTRGFAAMRDLCLWACTPLGRLMAAQPSEGDDPEEWGGEGETPDLWLPQAVRL